MELLKRLPDECIDLIYCDILYNTGRKFNDYDDNLGTPQEAIDWHFCDQVLEVNPSKKQSYAEYIKSKESEA